MLSHKNVSAELSDVGPATIDRQIPHVDTSLGQEKTCTECDASEENNTEGKTTRDTHSPPSHNGSIYTTWFIPHIVACNLINHSYLVINQITSHD